MGRSASSSPPCRPTERPSSFTGPRLCLTRISEPDKIGPELIRVLGPYQEYVSQMFQCPGIIDFTTCVEEADYQGSGFPRPPFTSPRRKGCDLFFSHWHFLMSEPLPPGPSGPNLDPLRPQGRGETLDMVRQAYRAIDHMMATLLEGVTKDDTVMIVSDHGCSSDQPQGFHGAVSCRTAGSWS